MPLGPERRENLLARTVLVSSTGERLFQETSPVGAVPFFYRFHEEKLPRKVMRKLGLRSPRHTLRDRMVFSVDPAALESVSALWLSSPVYLEPAVMNCLLDLLPHLRWIYSQSTGTEHLDLPAFERRKVMVSNSGTLVSRPVAEMALACLLDHAKRLPEHSELQRRRRWRSVRVDSLEKLTIGIVGTGNIGSELARLCRSLGMTTLAASRDPARFSPDASPYDRVLDLKEELPALLSQCDQVVLALPLNDETRGLFGARELARMKPDSALINVTRGPIVDESALCRALSAGQLGAAYLDRPATMPPPPWSRLYRTRNLHLTHYSAANTDGVQRKAFEEFLKGLRALDEGTSPANRVA